LPVITSPIVTIVDPRGAATPGGAGESVAYSAASFETVQDIGTVGPPGKVIGSVAVQSRSPLRHDHTSNQFTVGPRDAIDDMTHR
jgi:hypothetical protein